MKVKVTALLTAFCRREYKSNRVEILPFVPDTRRKLWHDISDMEHRNSEADPTEYDNAYRTFLD